MSFPIKKKKNLLVELKSIKVARAMNHFGLDCMFCLSTTGCLTFIRYEKGWRGEETDRQAGRQQEREKGGGDGNI